MYTENSIPIVGIEIETTLRGNPTISAGKEKIIRALAENDIDYCIVTKDDTTSDYVVFEIKLPPLAKSLHLHEILLKIEDALMDCGARITRKCGGHVHFGLEWLDLSKQTEEAFNEAQIAHVRANGLHSFYSQNKKDILPFQLAKIVGHRYGLNQHIIDGILPDSRTNNTYCKPIANQVKTRHWKNANTLEELNNSIGGKFYAVNYQEARMNGKRTIEFRQGSGTIEAKKIMNWIDLIYNLYLTTDKEFLNYGNTETTNHTPDQPYRQGTRLDQIYQLCRTDGGATVEDLMMATGTTRSNIAGRISEMRARFGDSSIVTGTQQSNGRSYGSGDEFASYKILKTFTTGSSEVSALPDNRTGNPSIWSGVGDSLFEYFNTRFQR